MQSTAPLSAPTLQVWFVGDATYLTEREAFRAAGTLARVSGEDIDVTTATVAPTAVFARRFSGDAPRAQRDDVVPNPLAAGIREDLEPLLISIEEHTGGLEIDVDVDCGIQDDAPGQYRPSTNDELRHAKFELSMSLHVDLTDDLVEQLTDWLKDAAGLLDVARVNLRTVTDDRDRDALRELLGESAIDDRR
ncbi:MAG: hypothetical protein JSS49_27410 [Planctomycetes bacterium]|nr:hypothetical protein [Planctomycetota bacterium]